METQTPPRLIDRLLQCARLWAEANGGSPAKLGRLALGDSSYFNRIESPQGTTTATLERFARFLGDPANWPAGEDGSAGVVPEVVRAFVHVVGVSPAAAPASPDKAGENIGTLCAAPVPLPDGSALPKGAPSGRAPVPEGVSPPPGAGVFNTTGAA